MASKKEFDTVLERLDKDLEELESVSTHLKEVKSFAENTKELGKKFTEHINKASQLVEDSTKRLDDFVQENGSKIKELTESHQKLAGRVKDMEDKVTVLNTKTESLSKEIGNYVNQLEKSFTKTIEEAKKDNKILSKRMIEHQETNRKIVIYLMIPTLLMLVALIIGVYM